MPLIPPLSEFRSTLLICELKGAKGWLKAVYEQGLNIVFVDVRVHLIKQLQEQVGRKIIGSPQNMDPGALPSGSGV